MYMLQLLIIEHTCAPPLPSLGSSGLGSLKGTPPISGIAMNASKGAVFSMYMLQLLIK